VNNKKGIFQVRLKSNGRFFSRHYTVRTPEQAAKRAKGMGTVQSIRKVHPSDITRTIGSMNLDDVIGIRTERKQSDVILNGTTLDSIVFPKIGQSKRIKRREQTLRKHKI